MSHNWHSIWISGGFMPGSNLYSSFYDFALAHCSQMGAPITHFGSKSPVFKGGKYLNFTRSRKRLLRSIERPELIEHLSFIEVRDPFTTMIGDCSFYIALSKKMEAVTADVRTDHYSSGFLSPIVDFAQPLFASYRTIEFVTAGDLPVNFVMNYDRREQCLPDHLAPFRILSERRGSSA